MAEFLNAAATVLTCLYADKFISMIYHRFLYSLSFWQFVRT